jgi:hypothetical protein
VVPQSAEYRSRGANPALLEALARTSGGRVDITPAVAFDPSQASQGAVREIGLPLLGLALLLLPIDVGLRRLLFARDQVAAALRRVGLERGRAEGTEAAEAHQEQQKRLGELASDKPPGEARAARRESSPQSKIQNPKSKIPADLERLREAQERARRRARGEE